MNMDGKVITVNGKEYKFLKPFPIDVVNVEKQSYVNGEFSKEKYQDGILRLVSKSLKKEDLVKFNGKPVTLENGVKLEPLEIPYKQYSKMLDSFQKDDATKVVKNFLSICNMSELKVEDLTMADIYNIFDAYASLYDSSELERVIAEVADFR